MHESLYPYGVYMLNLNVVVIIRKLIIQEPFHEPLSPGSKGLGKGKCHLSSQGCRLDFHWRLSKKAAAVKSEELPRLKHQKIFSIELMNQNLVRSILRVWRFLGISWRGTRPRQSAAQKGRLPGTGLWWCLPHFVTLQFQIGAFFKCIRTFCREASQRKARLGMKRSVKALCFRILCWPAIVQECTWTHGNWTNQLQGTLPNIFLRLLTP